MRAALSISGSVVMPVLCTAAGAADITVAVEVPRLRVAEYHRPYVAVWIERPDQGFVSNLAVWYDLNLKNGEGTTWLKDLRQWWRRSGRELSMPVDGISGATRPPGEHTLSFGEGSPPLRSLAPGSYQLVIEAAREVGGRELLRVPFQWPPRQAETAAARGEHELGAVQVTLKP